LRKIYTLRPKGTKDILPDENVKRMYFFDKAREVLERYNYLPITTPVFEHTELFIRGVGESTDIVQKEMYTFEDKGGRSLTLRPEGTAPIVRAFFENNVSQKLPKPVKLYYYGSMYRFERPQSGRYREFWQLGVEVLGSPNPLIDVEVIHLFLEILQNLGLYECNLLINSMGCKNCRPLYREALQKFLREKKENLCKTCQERVDRNPLRVFDCKNLSCRNLISTSPMILNFLCPECKAHFSEVKNLLNSLKVNFEVAPFLVRGLDYYRRTTFEVLSPFLGAQNALGGGGRYDGLAEELGGEPLPGVGFAMGVERILIHAEKEGLSWGKLPKPLVFIAVVDDKLWVKAFNLLCSLRGKGISAEMDFSQRGLSRQLKLSHQLGAKFTLFLGPDEEEKGIFKIRDMDSGKEWEILQEEAESKLMMEGKSEKRS
jgi:histidyl-tRNA synthetase